MTQELQKPNNLFATPQLTKPTEVYDPNQGWRGYADYRNIIAAQKIRPTQPQQQQTTEPQYQTQTKPVITSTEDLAKAMGYTSPQEEERLRKASVANQRILALGDALRHIGNIAGTINYAPSQKLSSPVQEEYARYQQGKAMRDKANQAYYSYQQKKTEQDAKARQWEAEQSYKNGMLKHYQDQERRLLARDEEAARRNSVLEYLKEKQMELNKNLQERKISIQEYNAQTARINAERRRVGGNSGGGRDFTTTITYEPNEYDPLTGRMIKKGNQTTTRKYKGGQGTTTSTTTTNGNNTPPSRRNSSSQNGNTAFKNFSIRKNRK